MTSGVVSRHFQEGKDATMMAVTADFARGSSGGPAFNDCGNVVGFVCSTSSVYYKVGQGRKDDLQMVFKNCVTAASVLKLIKRP